MFVIIVKIH